MATAVVSPPRATSPLAWLRDFLREELSPYPGRGALVTRMVIAATLVMIIGMTFQIPYMFQGAIFALIISRETPRSTLRWSAAVLVLTCMGAALLLLSATFVINHPLLHFLWVIGNFFLSFYGITVLTNYPAAVSFPIVVSVVVPLWDRHVPAETNVEDTLWLCLSILVGIVITAAVELVFSRLRPRDEIISFLNERLAAVENLLASYAEGRTVDPATPQKVMRFEMLGTSILRGSLRRSDHSPQYSMRMGGVISLVGSLVDSAAALTKVSLARSASEQKRFRNLVLSLATIRKDLANRAIPRPVHFDTDKESVVIPLLGDLERAVSRIPQVLADTRSTREYVASPDDMPRPAFVVPDALVNPEHLRFALRGCLAASICYVIYNAIAWPGISTAVTTCMLTALSTIGASRQKQILRITGAMVGGFVIGIGSQVFILPYLDSIAGFTVLFIAVTALSSWFITSSPRLSYFGVQVALAFYFINLSEFKMQTSLAVARDRVVGILLGLVVMWLVFDQLWGEPAVVGMKRTFISNLRLVAQFAREPLSIDRRTAVAQNMALRETINSGLDKVRALADGVLLEFGPSRQQDLALRDRIRHWQTELRILFITSIPLWKYRVPLTGFELPKTVSPALREFDNELAKTLDATADRLEGKPGALRESRLEDSFKHLEETVRSLSRGELQREHSEHLETLLTLSGRTEQLASSLEREIYHAPIFVIGVLDKRLSSSISATSNSERDTGSSQT